MNENSLPLELVARADAVCDAFESAWLNGAQPRIEDFLSDCSEAAKDHLLRNLLALDLHYRRKQGDRPTANEYRERFPTLYAGIEKVFSDHGESKSSATDCTIDKTPSPLPAPPPAIPGYEILEMLGRGGMGVVYKARQVGLERTVAIKMILAGPHAEDDTLKRFRSEAEAVARLQHPNIVQIFEIGEAPGPSGSPPCPYFSLEFAEGGGLDKQLNGTPQPPRQAAETIETLAGAVHQAHQAGIVHRDLKPANILLMSVVSVPLSVANNVEDQPRTTDQGLLTNPKISDFGLAKKIEAGSGITHTGAVMGTPSYMSPEQAAGKTNEVGPLADVYALGAVLYEMLTGRPPFRGESAWDTVAQVLQQEVVPPRRLQPKTPKDLETICLKCLHKEKQRRYATAEGLADDLRRFLDGRPILARPVSGVEKGWCWAKRNLLAAGLLLLVAILLVIGLPTMTILFVLSEYHRGVALENGTQALVNLKEMKKQRDRAEGNYQIFRKAVLDNITIATQHPLLEGPGMSPVRLMFVESSRKNLEKFIKKRKNDPGAKRDLAVAYFELAVTRRFTDPKQADLALDALRLAEELYLQTDPDKAERDTRDHLARLYDERGAILRRSGRLEQARVFHEKAIAEFAELAKGAPANNRLRYDLAIAYNNSGTLARANNQAALALTHYRKANDIFAELDKSAPSIKHRFLLAATFDNIGALQLNESNLQAAQKSQSQALRLFQQLAAVHPHSTQYQYHLALCEYNMAQLITEFNKPNEAAAFYQKAGDRFGKLVEYNPANSELLDLAARSHNNAAKVLERQKRFGDALQQFQRTINLVSKNSAAASPDLLDMLSIAYSRAGFLFNNHNEHDKALAYHTKDMELGLARSKRNPNEAKLQHSLAKSWNNIGSSHFHLGQTPEALEAYRQANGIWKKLTARYPKNAEYYTYLAKSYTSVGVAYGKTGNLIAKLTEYEHALSAWKKTFALEPKNTEHGFRLAKVQLELGNLYRQTGRPENMPKMWTPARKTLTAITKTTSRSSYEKTLTEVCLNLGYYYVRAGQNQKALPILEQAQRVAKKLCDKTKDDPECRRLLGSSHQNLGVYYSFRSNEPKELQKALHYFETAEKIFSSLAEAHPENQNYERALNLTRSNIKTVRKKLAQSKSG